MKSAFFNRFFVTSLLAYLALMLVSTLIQIIGTESEILTYCYAFSPVNILSLIFIFAVCVAGSTKAVDDTGGKYIKWIRIVFGALLLLYASSWFVRADLTLFISCQLTVILSVVLVFFGQRRQNTDWRKNGLPVSFFYLLMLSIILLGWFTMGVDNKSFLYKHVVIPMVLSYCFGSVFALSLLMFVVFFYWKRVKMISIIGGLAILGVFAYLYNHTYAFSYTYSSFSYYVPDDEYQDTFHFPAYEIVLADNEDNDSEYENEEEEEEGEEGEEGEIQPFALDFLWKNKAADRDSVVAAVRYYYEEAAVSSSVLRADLRPFEKARYTDQNKEDEEWNVEGKRAYSSIMSYLAGNRSNLNLRGMFKAYKPLLKILVSQEKYDDRHRETVDLLLAVYDDVDDNATFTGVYNVMIENRGGHAEMAYITRYVSRDTYYKFFIEYQTYYPERLIYYFSFWGRRAHEGNLEACASILREIQEMYSDNGGEEDYD